jgi:hypothetical protein
MMKKLIVKLMVVVLCMLCVEAQAVLENHYQGGQWNDANSWSDGVPTWDDFIYIDYDCVLPAGVTCDVLGVVVGKPRNVMFTVEGYLDVYFDLNGCRSNVEIVINNGGSIKAPEFTGYGNVTIIHGNISVGSITNNNSMNWIIDRGFISGIDWIPGDLNNHGHVDWEDFAIFASHWLEGE